jgi:hypothetical protein
MHRHGIGSSGLGSLRRVDREVLSTVGLFVMSEGAPIVRWCVNQGTKAVESGPCLYFTFLPLLRSLHSRRVDVPMIRE